MSETQQISLAAAAASVLETAIKRGRPTDPTTSTH
jgi:hypothetical protein